MMDIVLVMIYTGMRIGETLAVRSEDVHLAERWIAVHGTKTAAADRIVPIHRDIIPIIQARLDAGGELLFERDGGGKIGYYYFTLYFFDDFKKHFGFEQTPHACRHTFISLAMASEMNQVLIRKMVGHAASNVTESTYTHAYIADLVREIDKLKM
nr:MAG TPA: Integrase [Caudoviricetes sp.]